jgi:hypothetical protein
MIAEIQKQMKEARERWEKIDELTKKLEDQIEGKESINEEQAVLIDTTKLVILLAEQLKPMSTVDDGMKEILDAFTGVTGGKDE